MIFLIAMVLCSTSHRLLGGFIGDTDGVASLLTQCVVDWSAIVEKLVLICET